jgi:branched-chain amino acid transport system substrate-binding protein
MVTLSTVFATTLSAGAASSVPGVTKTSVTVGSLATLSGELASDFAPMIPGEKAYFDLINSQGGVYGRKINYAYSEDDGGNPGGDATIARQLIFGDHVFAVTGVATAFFSPQAFALTKTPTYGYNVSDNWNGSPYLFSAYGSVEDNFDGEPDYGFAAKTLKAKSVAVVAYNIAESNAACNDAVQGYQRFGIHVGYVDTNIAYGSSLTSDVQRMKAANVDFVLSCLDVTGNIAMTRAMDQYGIGNVNQLWLDGEDQSVVNQYSSIMQHVYFALQHVPLTSAMAHPSEFPGLALYIRTMNKYEPQYTGEELALEGWLNAELFVDGLKGAGPNPTQAKVVAADNKLTFTGDGITTPVVWKYAHTLATPPYCAAYVKVEGKKLLSVFAPGKEVFVCFNPKSNKPNAVNGGPDIPGGS